MRHRLPENHQSSLTSAMYRRLPHPAKLLPANRLLGQRHQPLLRAVAAVTPYSTFNPSFLISVAQRPSSRAILAVYSSGVLASGPPPSPIMRALTSSDDTILRSSVLSRAMIAGGVPAGATSP